MTGAYIGAMSEYMGAVLEERRCEPRTTSSATCSTWRSTAGRSTTTSSARSAPCSMPWASTPWPGKLGYAFLHLAEHPEHRRLVTGQPDRIPAFVEEALRMYSIVTTNRIVTRDVEFAGCPMKAGDRVLWSIPAADRDPLAFPDADRFDVDRASNRHIAFASGPHRCLGSHLARLELRIAMEGSRHRRIPEYRVAYVPRCSSTSVASPASTACRWCGTLADVVTIAVTTVSW